MSYINNEVLGRIQTNRNWTRIVHRQGGAYLSPREARDLTADRAWQTESERYIESFNGRLRDECLNAHFFAKPRARCLSELWRREYNEVRPKQVLGGLTPVRYARQLMAKTGTVTAGL